MKGLYWVSSPHRGWGIQSLALYAEAAESHEAAVMIVPV